MRKPFAKRLRAPTCALLPLKPLPNKTVHRIRSELVQHRTAKVNHIRGLLAEYGIVVGRRVDVLRKALPLLLEDAENGLTIEFRALLDGLQQDLMTLDERARQGHDRLAWPNAETTQ